MKKVVLTALALLAVLFLLPLLLFGGTGLSPLPALGGEPVETLPPQAAPVAIGPPDAQREVTLFHKKTGTVETLTMDRYLWGVVAAEMPASFGLEALKAQAVAARTYTLRKGSGTHSAHPEAMVCDNYACCQAYLTEEEARANWGLQAPLYTDKIRNAVSGTDGLALTYQGELIDAVFFSSSSGSTADAAEVWGNSVPYLQPVSTPEGEEVPNFHTTVTVPLGEFKEAILKRYPEVVLGEDYTAWFGPMTYTAAGAVDTLPVGGVPVKGTEYRSLFGLRSARFRLTVGEEGVVFRVTGYGHGAGMSQYGANAMAAQGEDFHTILTHYYTGVTVEKIPEKKES